MSDTTEGIERALVAWEGAARAATPGPWVTPHGLIVWADLGHLGSELIAAEMERENAEHIIRNDPAAVLRMVAGIRALVADITAERHEVVEDCWYTCGAATEGIDGGEPCDDRRGPECDCGRDARVARRLALIAAMFAPAAEGDAGVGS